MPDRESLSRQSYPVTLTDDERVVATAVYDLGGLLVHCGPATAATVADVASLGHRRFGVARASKTLGTLTARGLIRRRRPPGSPFVYEHVRWPTDEERG